MRDEGEIQNECDGPCYKVMLKVKGGWGFGFGVVAEQEVVTPYMWRNFVIGTTTAREGQLD